MAKKKQSKPKPKKTRSVKSKAGLLRISIVDLLPVKPSFDALEVDRQRSELYGHITMSHSEAFNRLEAIERRRPDPAQSPQALSLVSNISAIAEQHGDDALEVVRRKLGLTRHREELEQKLLSLVSVEYGLELFNRATEHFYKKRFASVTELNEAFPNITLLEIAFMALLKHAPFLFLANGTTFDPTKWFPGATGMGPEDILRMQQSVPMHFLSNVEAFVYSTDSVNPDPTMGGLTVGDIYNYLGFTGKTEGDEYIPYRIIPHQLIHQLVPLEMSNNRLHERVWHCATAGVQIGLGRVAAEAYRRALNLSPDAKLTVSLAEAILKLSGADRVRFDTEQQQLEDRIYACTVIDLGRTKLLRKHDLFRLIAIFGQIPNVFLEEAPFYGYIVPYGVGVKFINCKGQVVDFMPYSEWYIREAVFAFHDEVTDLSSQNRTVSIIFDRLKRQAEEKLFREYYLSGLEMSVLEQLVIDIDLRYGVKLEIIPRQEIVEITDWNVGLFRYGVTPDGYHITTNLKFGVAEAKSIEATLGLLPRAFLSGFRSISKFNLGYSLDELMAGATKMGEFLPTTKTIALYEPRREIYNSLSPARRALHAHTLVHEIGESVWPTLSDDQRQRWESISWTGKRVDKRRHFLTWYSLFVGARDDFCEHFACYLFHGEEFREKAKKYRALSRKYRFLRELFKERTGAPKDYPRLLPWTIEELHGELEQEAEKRSLAEAQATLEEIARSQTEAVLESAGAIVSSVEQLAELELEQTDENAELD